MSWLLLQELLRNHQQTGWLQWWPLRSCQGFFFPQLPVPRLISAHLHLFGPSLCPTSCSCTFATRSAPPRTQPQPTSGVLELHHSP